MRALTVRQPWAHLIVAGQKDIENRSWPTRHRGRLLIHAGKQIDWNAYDWLDEHGLPLPYPDDLPLGGIIGAVMLTGCVRDDPSPWAMGNHWHWQLGDAEHVPFRACAGRLGLWTP